MNPADSIVRSAKPEDRQEVWRLLLQGHRENGLFELSTDKVNWLLDRVLSPEKIAPNDIGPRGLIGVIGEPGKLEAIAFLLIGQFWYSSDPHLEELIVFVDPECRKSHHAQEIIAWMKRTSDVLDIPILTGIISKDRTAAKIRLYDRFLPRIGAFYLYPINGKDVKRKNHHMQRDAWLQASK